MITDIALLKQLTQENRAEQNGREKVTEQDKTGAGKDRNRSGEERGMIRTTEERDREGQKKNRAATEQEHEKTGTEDYI